MTTLSIIAFVVGWVVLCAIATALAAGACLLAWACFPLRFDWMRLHDAKVSTRVGTFPVTYWIGFSSRRSPKGWFFGFQHYGEITED